MGAFSERGATQRHVLAVSGIGFRPFIISE